MVKPKEKLPRLGNTSRVKTLARKWKKCLKCGSIFDNNDENLHAVNHCPPVYGENQWGYGHIYNHKFYSFVKQFEPSVNDKDLISQDNFIRISLSVIQLCKFIIGDYVAIMGGNNRVVAKRVWPLNDNVISAVFITITSMKELNYYTGPVIIRSLSENLLPIKEISVKLVHPPTMEQDLLTRLLSSANYALHDRIVCIGQNITFPFYGLDPILEVVAVTPVEHDAVTELVNVISSISLSSDDEKQFFKITSSTIWRSNNLNDHQGDRLRLFSPSKLGGVRHIISSLQDVLENIKQPAFPKRSKFRGVLLCGISGTGKTQICKTVAYNSGIFVTEITSWDTYSKYYGEAESRLKVIFDSAITNAPSIILIDELDSFCGKKSGSDQEHRVMTTLLMMLDKLKGHAVLALATTRQPDLIDSAFRRPGRFAYEIEVTVPTSKERTEILNCLLTEYNHRLTEDEIELISAVAHGFVGSDLALVCSHANTKAAIDVDDKNDVTITYLHMKWALTVVKPSAMREILIEIPNVKWNDIGGEDELKTKLKQVLEWPLKYPESFSRLGICPPRGILLFGPPGCSKTMIAKAVATESKLNFISIKGAELYSKWVGESEKAVREVFRRARNVAPAVVFFDEIDALAGERTLGSNESGGISVQERVLSQLLTELDGIESLSGVTVVAATNRPDKIDSALLRPGRLDRKLYVQLPDKETRKAIFNLRFKSMPVSENVDINELTELTEGYSGAEVVAVCYEAAIRSLHENLEANQVQQDHFLYALATINARTPKSLLEIYQRFIND